MFVGQDLYPIAVAALAVALASVSLCIFLLLTAFRVRKSSEESVKTMAASLNRLEKLFDQVFSDTFFMLRETLSYSLRQTIPENLQSGKVRQDSEPATRPVPLASVESRLIYLEKSLAEIARSQRKTGDLISELRQDMTGIAPEVRQNEPAPAVTPVNHTRPMILATLEHLRQTQPRIHAAGLLKELEKKGKPATEVVRELEAIEAEGLIQLSDASPIDANTTITLK